MYRLPSQNSANSSNVVDIRTEPNNLDSRQKQKEKIKPKNKIEIVFKQCKGVFKQCKDIVFKQCKDIFQNGSFFRQCLKQCKDAFLEHGIEGLCSGFFNALGVVLANILIYKQIHWKET